MQQSITPATSIGGSIRLPGDKSISHRYAMLAAIAEGPSKLRNYSTGADCQSTLKCVEALGVEVEKAAGEVVVRGRGLNGLKAPEGDLDAGNSGSTIRMFSGILAAQKFTTRIGGDESLSRRPMARIMKPLAEMGAKISARDGQFPPLTIEGGPLTGIDYTTPVASAQVKSCVLFGGINASGHTTVREAIKTRDHSEIALREFGADLILERGAVTITGGVPLKPRELLVPGDLSSAAFFIVAALMSREANLVIHDVGLNPTRSTLLDFLAGMGAQVKVLDMRQSGGEVLGDILIRHSKLKGGLIEKAWTAALIDEIPVLAVLGATTEEGLIVRDAKELRVKETDRIATVAENMKRMGVEIEVYEDGFRVPGKQTFQAAEVNSFGDHRIAMAFAVAGLSAKGGATVVEEAEAASVSFPEFYGTLKTIAS